MEGKICRGNFSEENIRQVFNEFKHGFVYSMNGEPFAFVLWSNTIAGGKSRETSEPVHSQMSIQLACGIEKSFQILDLFFADLQAYCDKHMISSIRTVAYNKKLEEYYKTRGFSDEDRYGYMTMPVESVMKIVKHKRNIPRTRKNSRKSRAQLRIASDAVEAIHVEETLH